MAHQTFPKPTRTPKAKNRTVTKRRKSKWRISEIKKRHVYEIVNKRDNYMCVVPQCNSISLLHHHHITPRSLGGEHTTANICLVCPRHHEQIHYKELTIIGNADYRLSCTWH